ncbi:MULTISPECIES: LacI family DNA-binding transcriptional regulator [Streptomyces]|uniref:LacI family transcriptional regulator n=1 Tax=Streptomyces dengpaensis TaxID=2049881 RepID=A0ABM6SSB8_9ACTN|nr:MULTISPECIES: LacI family DNA-binding transcriptional regulator [Streptomyces]AVH57422.1 LacI family transcriptional regulator [Streptomyces dengpaensis]PIB05549.1 LacI family transcriptional regulator [Streptomyces sp. HG99]
MASSGTGPRRVTIDDVARSAGVSRQTVSRALNDKNEIGESTKQRVLDAALELGYRPSRFARGLVRQDTISVGLVIPDLLNPFFTEVAAAALDAARARGWHVVVYDTGDRVEEERGTLAVIASQVDAVVGYLSQPEDEIDKLTRGLPVVLIDREHHAERFSAIRIDGKEGVHAAISYLVESGHRRIGMLDHAGRSEPSIRHDWFAGAMTACGLDAGPVSRADQSVEGGENALKELLAAHPDVTAVFTFNDIIAIGALRAARRLGRTVPQDLAVIGFDGLRLGELVEPPLSTVALDTRHLGALAVEQTARLLTRSGPLSRDELVVRAELRRRESA